MKTQRIFVVCLLLAVAAVLSAQPTAAPGPQSLDHFNFYLAVPPQPHQSVFVLIQDEFDQASATAPAVFEKITDLSPFRLCAPAQKTVAVGVTTTTFPINNPGAHLLM